MDAYTIEEAPDVDADELGSVMRTLVAGTYPFRLEHNPPLPVEEMVELYRDPAFVRRTGRECTLISTYAFVDPAGRLYPCLTLDMGNVFDRPFEEVWTGRGSARSGACCGASSGSRCANVARRDPAARGEVTASRRRGTCWDRAPDRRASPVVRGGMR